MEEILAVTKHAINSDLDNPLNELITQVTSNLEDYIRKNIVSGGHKLFTSSGEFTVPENVEQIYITAIGSGASGGAGGTGFKSSIGSAPYYGTGGGGGGGAGRHIKDKVFVVTPGESIPITINPAGAGVSGGKPDSLLDLETLRVNGNSGGSVIIGSLVTVAGGSYGYGAYGVHSEYTDDTSAINSGGAGGSLNGTAGSGGYSGTSTTASAGSYGTGGTNPNVFKGAYGKGGRGGNGVVGNSNSYHLGGSSNSGTTGAVLICWGGYRHDSLYS